MDKSISVLGPEGTYSDKVAKSIINNDDSIHYVTIDQEFLKKLPDSLKGSIGNISVLESIEKHDAIIVPMHNTYGGNVIFQPEVIYQLKQKFENLHIIGWYQLQIEHILASKNKLEKNEIKRIYSHPQGLLQCSDNIKKISDTLQCTPTPSTLSKINNLREKEAIICSREAANEHKLYIIDEKFGPKDNITDFAVITKDRSITSEQFRHLTQSKIFLILHAPDEEGIFKKVLNIICPESPKNETNLICSESPKNKTNLISIHSHGNGKKGIDFPIIIENNDSLNIAEIRKKLQSKVNEHITLTKL